MRFRKTRSKPVFCSQTKPYKGLVYARLRPQKVLRGVSLKRRRLLQK